jgi:hypothetical protein
MPVALKMRKPQPQVLKEACRQLPWLHKPLRFSDPQAAVLEFQQAEAFLAPLATVLRSQVSSEVHLLSLSVASLGAHQPQQVEAFLELQQQQEVEMCLILVEEVVHRAQLAQLHPQVQELEASSVQHWRVQVLEASSEAQLQVQQLGVFLAEHPQIQGVQASLEAQLQVREARASLEEAVQLVEVSSELQQVLAV